MSTKSSPSKAIKENTPAGAPKKVNKVTKKIDPKEKKQNTKRVSNGCLFNCNSVVTAEKPLEGCIGECGKKVCKSCLSSAIGALSFICNDCTSKYLCSDCGKDLTKIGTYVSCDVCQSVVHRSCTMDSNVLVGQYGNVCTKCYEKVTSDTEENDEAETSELGEISETIISENNNDNDDDPLDRSVSSEVSEKLDEPKADEKLNTKVQVESNGTLDTTKIPILIVEETAAPITQENQTPMVVEVVQQIIVPKESLQTTKEDLPNGQQLTELLQIMNEKITPAITPITPEIKSIIPATQPTAPTLKRSSDKQITKDETAKKSKGESTVTSYTSEDVYNTLENMEIVVNMFTAFQKLIATTTELQFNATATQELSNANRISNAALQDAKDMITRDATSKGINLVALGDSLETITVNQEKSKKLIEKYSKYNSIFGGFDKMNVIRELGKMGVKLSNFESFKEIKNVISSIDEFIDPIIEKYNAGAKVKLELENTKKKLEEQKTLWTAVNKDQPNQKDVQTVKKYYSENMLPIVHVDVKKLIVEASTAYLILMMKSAHIEYYPQGESVLEIIRHSICRLESIKLKKERNGESTDTFKDASNESNVSAWDKSILVDNYLINTYGKEFENEGQKLEQIPTALLNEQQYTSMKEILDKLALLADPSYTALVKKSLQILPRLMENNRLFLNKRDFSGKYFRKEVSKWEFQLHLILDTIISKSKCSNMIWARPLGYVMHVGDFDKAVPNSLIHYSVISPLNETNDPTIVSLRNLMKTAQHTTFKASDKAADFPIFLFSTFAVVMEFAKYNLDVSEDIFDFAFWETGHWIVSIDFTKVTNLFKLKCKKVGTDQVSGIECVKKLLDSYSKVTAFKAWLTTFLDKAMIEADFMCRDPVTLVSSIIFQSNAMVEKWGKKYEKYWAARKELYYNLVEAVTPITSI